MRKILDKDSVEELGKLLAQSDKIVLTCHVNPDGDALGSTLGWWHLLRSLGKNPTVIVPDQPPRSLRFLPGFKDIAIYTRHDPYCTHLVEECDLIICCDFNEPKRQDHLAPLIQEATAPKVLIDHHEGPDMDCQIIFSFPKMSSTCELVFRIIAALGYYNELNLDAATCLLTGIITDTRNFTVSCSDPEIYDILKLLLEKGCNKKLIVEEALDSCRYDSLRLQAFALYERMELFAEHHCALITLSKSDLEQFHYERGDSEGLVNQPLRVKGIIYSVFMREDANQIKISARSKKDFPVRDICKDLWQGGGHIQAAGAEFKGSLQDCRQMFVDSLKNYDHKLPRHVEDIDI